MRILSRTVSRGAAAILATLVLSSVASAQATGRKNGDVNNDGNVSAVDALAVLNAVAELPAATGNTPSWGDANCDGKVTALDAQIILAFTVSLDVSQFCVNQVRTATVSVVTVDAGTGQVMVGGTLQLAATPRDSTNAELTGKTATWSTSDAAKATVSSSGVVTGVGIGDATITATIDGKTGTTIVSVIAASASSTIEVTPRTTTLLKDSSLTLTGVVKDAAGNPLTNRTITWSAEKSTILQVNSTTGVVKGLALGTSKVYATSNTQKDSATITVTASGATATKTWTGATSTDWGTAGNWSPVGVPVVTDTVYVPVAPTNKPVLGTGTTIAGLVVQTGSKVTVGTYELQVTGRADVDGEVVGAGKITMQGVSTRESYLRGKLPNVEIIGTTVITAATTITGTLEITPTSIFEVDRYAVDVSANLIARGGLRMQSSTSKLTVKGNARFFNDASRTDAILSAGTLQVGGNLHLVVPGVAVSPFPASGTHRTVLDGAGTQFVRDSGLAVAELQELDISNTAGGVVFETSVDTMRFRVKGRMRVLTGTSVSGSGRVNVMQTYTQAAQGSVTLRNLGVQRAFASGGGFKPDTLTLTGGQTVPGGSAYEFQTIVAAATAALSGPTNAAGSVIIGCVTLYSDCTTSGGAVIVNGQKLTVAKDLRQGKLSTGALSMVKTADSVIVAGGLLGPVGLTTGPTEFTVNDGDWTAGVLRVGGEFRARGIGAKGSHLTVLDGALSQSLRVIKGFSLQSFNISNTGGVVMNDTTTTVQQSQGRHRLLAVRGDFNLTTPVKLSGTARLDVSGNVQTATGSTVEVSAISVGQTLQSAGSYVPDTAEFNNPGTAQTIQNLPAYNTVVVRGKAAFGGSMTFKGSLIVRDGAELNTNGRHVTVTKQMLVSGILRMQDIKDTITVLGDSTVFYARNDPSVKNYATSGVLRAGGKLVVDSTGFYPTGVHKIIYTGRSGDFNKTAMGVFNHLEVLGVNTAASAISNTINVKNAMIHGNLTATGGATKIRFDTTVVDGNAEITQADTVTLYSPDTTAGIVIKGNLRLKNILAYYTRVTGNVTVVDGARPQGYLRHSGKYSEEGTVTAGTNVWQVGLEGVASVRYIQQPTNTKVNTVISPTVTIELLDKSNKRIVGNALVVISGSALPPGVTYRVITVDGVGTLTGVTTGSTAQNGLRLLAGTGLVNWFYNTFMSNGFDVTP